MVDLLSASGEDDLHRLRLKAGLTLEELASLGGVGVSSVKRWESGSGTGVVRVPLDGVADALGVTVDEVRAAITRGRLS